MTAVLALVGSIGSGSERAVEIPLERLHHDAGGSVAGGCYRGQIVQRFWGSRTALTSACSNQWSPSGT